MNKEFLLGLGIDEANAQAIIVEHAKSTQVGLI
jgi:hypothetical protein